MAAIDLNVFLPREFGHRRTSKVSGRRHFLASFEDVGWTLGVLVKVDIQVTAGDVVVLFA